MTDFFISYNKADRLWAEWIAWTLEEASYSVVIQAWDFRPGGNFVLEMQRAAADSQKTIIVLSESYLKASFTQPEWATAFSDDPESLKRKLLPVRVKECKPEGLLKSLIYVDLVGLSEVEAKDALLNALPDRAKPNQKPAFPDASKPTVIETPQSFPRSLDRVKKLKEEALQRQLDNKIEDYNAVAKKQSYTTSPVELNALNRQLQSLSEELDQIASELDALSQ